MNLHDYCYARGVTLAAARGRAGPRRAAYGCARLLPLPEARGLLQFGAVATLLAPPLLMHAVVLARDGRLRLRAASASARGERTTVGDARDAGLFGCLLFDVGSSGIVCSSTRRCEAIR